MGVVHLSMPDILGIQAHGGISGSVELTQMFFPCFQISERVLGWTARCGLLEDLSSAVPEWSPSGVCWLLSPCLLASPRVCVEKESLGKSVLPMFNVFPACCVPCAQVPGNYPPAGFCC